MGDGKVDYESFAVDAVLSPILVWRFEDAPEELQRLSDNGGDEDWIALIPPDKVEERYAWMDEGSRFGCCNVSVHKLEDGSEVRIGAHA